MKNATVRLRVGKILEAKQMTIKDFERASGLDYQTARSLARGIATRIGLSTIDRTCEALKVEPGELFERTHTP